MLLAILGNYCFTATYRGAFLMSPYYEYPYLTGWWWRLKEKIKHLRWLTDPRTQIYDGHSHILHDRLHLLVAQMDPIQIGGYWVDGISGLNLEMFNHPPNFEAQYDGGKLDELRVAIHEVIVIPSGFSILRYLEWCRWMALNRINPIRVTCQHYRAYKMWLNKGNSPYDLPKA
jgi:hypothetical protein